MKRSFHRTVVEKILFALAWLALGLGAVGVVVPILPTTPLFAKSSPRFDAWLRTTKLYRNYVVPFRETGGMTARKKVTMFVVTAVTCGISFALVDVLVARAILVVVVVGMGVALTVRIKTITPEEEARFGAGSGRRAAVGE